MVMATPPVRHTVREQIMQSLKSIFEDAPDNPDDVTWDVVERRPFTKEEMLRWAYCLSIFDVSERIRPAAGFEYRNLNVVFEFHVQLAEGDAPSTFLNHCLGSIANRIGSDITLGGLTLNAEEQGSELDIDGAFDKNVSGIIVFDVSYRCRSNDPYTRV